MERYARGQIVVNFKKDVGIETAELLGNRFGLKLLINEQIDGGYVYETRKGQEKRSAESFKKRYPEFIEGADRRDILYEQRYDKIQSLEDHVIGLKETDIVNSPTSKQFNASLDKLIEYIQTLKE